MKPDKADNTNLSDIEMYPDAMERTERAIKKAFRTSHVATGAVKRAVAIKPKAKRRAAKKSR
jgi:hypothetical protein